jgi:hypothetical protein
LAGSKQDERVTGPDDDTETMVGKPFGRGGDRYVPYNAPRGPRVGSKRARGNEDKMMQVDGTTNLPYEDP